MRRKRKDGWTVLALLCMALFLISFCSQSSPLYPLNTWDDANCLLTVGRAMRAGSVLYRDIYEQKGPTLYLIHLIAACIRDTSFFGVYLLEVLACFLTLAAAFRILAGNGTGRALMFTACFGALLYASGTFSRGDSAEEFCLPCLMWMLRITEQMATGDEHAFTPGRLFALGMLSGIVATIKFTILGIPLGICLYVAFRLGGRDVLQMIRAGIWFLTGMCLPILAWIVYFYSQHALLHFYTAYIHNNIFLYAGERNTLRDWAYMLRGNWPWLLMLIPSLVWMIKKRTFWLILPFLVQGLVLFLGGRMWLYTLLVVSIFSVYGLLLVDRHIPSLPPALTVTLSLAALGMAAWMTPNAYMRFVPADETPQGHLCEQIEPGATFLQYSHLDDGLYLLTGTLPQGKYFCRLNVRLAEMEMELDRYLEEGIPQYVLITWRMLPERFTRYRQIDYANGYDDYNHLRKDFFLYERIE